MTIFQDLAAARAFVRESRLRPPPAHQHHRSEDRIVSSLASSSDLFVHWGVYESGKTTSVRNAAQRLQDEHGRTVVFKTGYDLLVHDDTDDFYTLLALPPRFVHLCTDRLQQPVTIVIDHFDEFVWPRLVGNRALMDSFLRCVQHDVRTTLRLNILLVFTSWELAKDVIDATSAIWLAAVGRWTPDELMALYEHITTPQSIEATDIIRQTLPGGCPGLLIRATYLLMHSNEEAAQAITPRAEIYRREWENGTRVLSGAPANGVVGRFPDREFNFHHEDEH